MPKYKVSASKDQKKYSFVFTASSKSEAKKRVHDKGYSILAVEELDETKLNGEKIIFKAIKDGEIKNGKVIGTDLFKIYLKLTDGLGYDVNEIFYEKDKDISTEEKEKLLIKIKKQYNLYHELNSKNKKEKSKSEKFKEKEGKYDLHTEGFYLRKKLEENYKLLNFVLEKLQNLFTDEKFSDLEQEKIKKLQEIYNKLIILKQSTNIGKIKQVSELALIKIGEIELSFIENKKDKNVSKLLDNTNKLLKQIGSKTQFRPKNKDINYQLKVKYEHIKKIIQDYIKGNLTKNKKVIDEQSTFYLSTVLGIKKYKNRLQNNTRNILKNIYVFLFPFGESKEKRDRLLIERRLINSNLILLKSKINQNDFSYTKVKKGYKWFVDIILLFFESIRKYLFIVIFFYSLLFLLILLVSYYDIVGLSKISELINYRGIFYFIVFLFIYLAMYLSKGFWTLIINFFIVFFLIIFGLINF